MSLAPFLPWAALSNHYFGPLSDLNETLNDLEEPPYRRSLIPFIALAALPNPSILPLPDLGRPGGEGQGGRRSHRDAAELPPRPGGGRGHFEKAGRSDHRRTLLREGRKEGALRDLQAGAMTARIMR